MRAVVLGLGLLVATATTAQAQVGPSGGFAPNGDPRWCVGTVCGTDDQFTAASEAATAAKDAACNKYFEVYDEAAASDDSTFLRLKPLIIALRADCHAALARMQKTTEQLREVTTQLREYTAYLRGMKSSR